jgi:hypothetical protein
MKRNLSFICIMLLLFSCKKDQENSSGGGSPQQLQITSYPLTIGYSWKYYTETHIVDSTGTAVLDDYYDNYWSVISDSTINGIACARVFKLDSNYDGSTHLGYTYYANTQDGFYGVAVENQGGLFFLRPDQYNAANQFSLMSSFANAPLNTVFVPDTPLRLLKFPAYKNDIWLSYEFNNPVPDIIKRKYLGYATVTTPAGTFNCVKLQMFWDYDNNNLPDSGQADIYQYFSAKGLIQEEWNEAVTSLGGEIDSIHRTAKLVWKNF